MRLGLAASDPERPQTLAPSPQRHALRDQLSDPVAFLVRQPVHNTTSDSIQLERGGCCDDPLKSGPIWRDRRLLI